MMTNEISNERLQELIDRYKLASDHGRYIGSFDDKEESVDIQSGLEEIQTLREQKGKYIENQVKQWGITAQNYENEIAKLEKHNKALIEDAEYWFEQVDAYAINNIPAVIERTKKHNALMQETK